MDAFFLVDFQPVKAVTVQKAVDGPQGTQHPAEEAVDHHAAYQDDDQKGSLPDEHGAHGGVQRFIGTHQGHGAGEGAGRADVLAEGRIAKAVIGEDHRPQQQDGKEDILDVFHPFGQAQLFQRDFVEQFLDQPEGTQKTAYEPAQHHADGQQKAHHIEAEIEFYRAHHRLQSPDGAGGGGCRTGIAVQPGIAEILPFAGVQLAGEEIAGMKIAQAEGGNLDAFAADILSDLHFPTPKGSRKTGC